MPSIFLNQNLKFRFNPFGGITTDELKNIIVPKSHFEKIKTLITSSSPTIIELVGKKGRGKTTHLTYLQQYFPEYPILLLSLHNNTFPNEYFEHKIVFIDSIHHLSFRKRIEIFRKFDKVILTTHITRFLEYKYARRAYQSFHFKGLKKEVLRTVIEKRIQLAIVNSNVEKIHINESFLSELINKFGDDFRGILNHLYENFE